MIFPTWLQRGDKVAVVAPSGNLTKELSFKFFEKYHLKVVAGKNLYLQNYRFAGTDEQRLQDLQQALDSTDIKAIFCARGGYGITRIIDQLDFSNFLQQPKWIIGYSDITALLLHAENSGIASIHASMVKEFSLPEYETSVKALFDVLFGKINPIHFQAYLYNRYGTAQATLTGGNLTMICNTIGTKNEINTNGKILFVEEIGEHLYQIDRMLVQLKRCGKLEKLAGLLIGHFTNTKDEPPYFGKTTEQIVQEVVQEYDYPVAFGFPVGHESPSLPVILGNSYQLVVNEKGSELSCLDLSNFQNLTSLSSI